MLERSKTMHVTVYGARPEGDNAYDISNGWEWKHEKLNPDLAKKYLGVLVPNYKVKSVFSVRDYKDNLKYELMNKGVTKEFYEKVDYNRIIRERIESGELVLVMVHNIRNENKEFALAKIAKKRE